MLDNKIKATQLVIMRVKLMVIGYFGINLVILFVLSTWYIKTHGLKSLLDSIWLGF